jgi:hypothetical protein
MDSDHARIVAACIDLALTDLAGIDFDSDLAGMDLAGIDLAACMDLADLADLAGNFGGKDWAGEGSLVQQLTQTAEHTGLLLGPGLHKGSKQTLIQIFL